MNTVIVGGVANGASAAIRLRRLDEQADIVLLERGAYLLGQLWVAQFDWRRDSRYADSVTGRGASQAAAFGDKRPARFHPVQGLIF